MHNEGRSRSETLWGASRQVRRMPAHGQPTRNPLRTVPETIHRARMSMLRDRPVDAREAARIGADVVLEELAMHGCRTVFGYPGGVLLPLYDVLGRHSEIRHVLVRHEQDAAHAADGYARAAGSPGVCLGTSGPGATNLITGVATAWRSQTPILVITGNVASGLLGRDAFQEVDITGITLPITKANTLVRSGAEIRPAMRAALQRSVAETPGPTHVDITKDALEALVAAPAPARPSPPRYVADDCSRAGERPEVPKGGCNQAADSRIMRRLLRVVGRSPLVLDGALQSLTQRVVHSDLLVWGPGPLDTPGYAIPAALGASLALGRPAWAITDAGGFQRSFRELVTITQEAARVKILHLASRGHQGGFVPDAIGIAAASGVDGIRVRHWDELGSALEAAAEAERAVLVSFEVE